MSRTSLDRRRRILAAALGCFDESGVEAASIAEICARSGASVGSVYHHFGNKDGIVRALLVEGLRSNMEHLRARLARVQRPREAVQTVVRSLIEWIVAHPDWARFIYANLGDAGHRNDPGLRAVNAEYARLIADHFGPHLRAGAFRHLPRECWASLVLGPAHDYARRWLKGQTTTPPSTHVEVFARAAWDAVRRPRAR